ncbi:ParA family protein [Prosthecobacter vanneervenii]|uniref:Chromosome partitioning protein n=1 Tax=Prosthecobacter vanneervenii TaxID=48466 RepID=A0A7W7Y899_9BACT|nr:ParA family protein [Prosthecobacter vanneervenii]MBB5031080.1 chromosome partitioning protein [Prosthecobacter vanneervenii]
MRIVAISNQKGGVGKTTTALNLAACLSQLGVRVLLVDLDPQANATSGLGLAQEEGGSIYSALVEGADPRQAIRSTRLPNLSIIRSHQELAGCEIELAQSGNHLGRLKDVLTPLRESGHFDYAILDTPPSLGVLMTGALAAADELLVPIQCEYFGLEGLSKIVSVVQQIRDCGANPNLVLEGIVMTMYDSRANLANQVVNDVRNYFAEICYQTVIPRTVRLGEAPSFGKSIIEYEYSGRGAQAYRALAEEFLARRSGAAQAAAAEESPAPAEAAAA